MTDPKNANNHDRLDDLARRAAEMKDAKKPDTVMHAAAFSPFAPFVNAARGVGHAGMEFYRNAIEPLPYLKWPLLILGAVPIIGFMGLKAVAKTAAFVWKHGAYKKDKDTGEKKISWKRATALGCAGAFAIVGATPTHYGSAVRYFTVEPVSDAVGMVLMPKKDEKLYLNHSEEISPENNIYTVRGCRVAVGCGENDAVYFRVMPRLSHNIWSFFNNGGKPVFIPDHVIAPIAPGVNDCKVTSYGIRLRAAKWAQVYPHMLSATCTSVAFESASQRQTQMDEAAAIHSRAPRSAPVNNAPPPAVVIPR